MKVFFLFRFYGDTTETQWTRNLLFLFCFLLFTLYICSNDLMHNLLCSCPNFYLQDPSSFLLIFSSSSFIHLASPHEWPWTEFPPLLSPSLLLCLSLIYLVFTRLCICLTNGHPPPPPPLPSANFPSGSTRRHQQHDGKPLCLTGPLFFASFLKHTHGVIIRRVSPTLSTCLMP